MSLPRPLLLTVLLAATACGPDPSSSSLFAQPRGVIDHDHALLYDPQFALAPECSEHWIGVHAEARRVDLLFTDGRRVKLRRDRSGLFTARLLLPRGTLLQLEASQRDGSRAISVPFAYLFEDPFAAPTEPAAAGDAATPAVDAGAPAEADAGSAPTATEPDAGSAPISTEPDAGSAPIPTEPDAGSAPGTGAVDAGTSDPPAEPGPGPDYDPGFRLSSNCNSWWLEVYADAASVEVELDGGARVSLAAQSWGSFAVSQYFAAGTAMRLHARRADGATAWTEWFGFLVDSPVLAAAPAATTAGYDPNFRLSSNCNSWWLEVYADAASVEAELASGLRFALPPQSWGSFAVSRELPAGTALRLQARRADGAVARSRWFAFLLEQPVLDDGSATDPGPTDPGTTDPGTTDPGTTDPGTTDPGTPPPPTGNTQWLHTAGNHIYRADGSLWVGRGANIHDTRGCNACTWQAPNVAEVKRRIDTLVDDWHADFLRLNLENYATAGGRTHWQSLLDDPAYLADIVEIVDHVGTKPGVYVMVSLWAEPTVTDLAWPSAATQIVWRALAGELAGRPQVLFGLVNEPEQNYSGSYDAAVWQAMNDTAQVIRDVENELGLPHHLIAVQGTGGWARFLNYYTTHPISAGGGGNIIYETHVYDPASTFAARFGQPSQTIPVIIGEFGPVDYAGMTLADCATLMQQAEDLGVPYLAWTFHGRCAPNLVVDNSGGGCGINMPLQPTPWGQLLKDRLASPL